MEWTKKPTGTARRLRRDLTKAERVLWKHLRDRALAGAKFRRQHPVGRYVADFACVDAKLLIEIDGGQHAARTKEDAARTRALEATGYRVIRFWNHEVLENIEGVAFAIERALKMPSPQPSPARGRGRGPATRQRGGRGEGSGSNAYPAFAATMNSRRNGNKVTPSLRLG
jgi:very-short-patch-repair endonuclease